MVIHPTVTLLLIIPPQSKYTLLFTTVNTCVQTKNTVLSWKNYGPIGLPEVTGIPAFTFVVAFIVCGMLLLRFLDKKGL